MAISPNYIQNQFKSYINNNYIQPLKNANSAGVKQAWGSYLLYCISIHAR
jgi:hypothetical protein